MAWKPLETPVAPLAVAVTLIIVTPGRNLTVLVVDGPPPQQNRRCRGVPGIGDLSIRETGALTIGGPEGYLEERLLRFGVKEVNTAHVDA